MYQGNKGNREMLQSNRKSGCKLMIKQEVIDDSPKPSPATIKSEDSCSSSYSGNYKEAKQVLPSKLPELKRALELNQTITSLLAAEIKRINTAYEKNLEKQGILQKLLDEDKDAKLNYKPPSQVRAISVFAAPYFRDVKKMVPPLNEDAKLKRRTHDVDAYLKPPRPWTKAENKKLLDGVTAFALLSALKPYKLQRDHLKKKLKDQNVLEFELEIIEKEIASIEKKIHCVSRKPLNELLDEVEGRIDWLTVSAVNMEGEKTPEECENMWNNFLNFSINKESFTFEEDERLKNIAEDHNERDWDAISRKLGTNRTAIQCFERFQTRLSKSLRRSYWTPEEDKKLHELVEQYRCGKIISWNKISLLMVGRTRQQIINRYERSVNIQYNRGPWKPEEDAILIACYHKFGCHWNKMKDFFRRRSTCNLRERYVNSLDPNLKMGGWTKEEDRELISLIQKYGYGKWSKICKYLPGRTDNMCLVRAGRLLEYSVKYHSENLTGEYDPGVNDPETFAKILKPLAPTKECFYRNMKLRTCREDAIEMLLIALKRVVPDFEPEAENLNSIDFSWLSHELLHRLSKELYNMLEERLKDKEPYVPRQKYMLKPPKYRKRLFEDSSEEEFQPSPEKPMSKEKQDWMESVIHEIFLMASKVFAPIKRNKNTNYNNREMAEISLYKAYLYKQFHCLAACDEDDDIENVVFGGIDFSETLQTVVSFFIQPPIYEGQFIILAPNMTTIGGMEVMEVTENRLQVMSNHVSHSEGYMDYLCERRKSCPKCLQCLHKDQIIFDSEEKAREKMFYMEKDLFIVHDSLKEAANVEAAVLNQSYGPCSCAELEESKKSVQLLRQRFMALFLWPALLSATDFNQEQEDILCTPESYSEVEKNCYYRMNACKKGGEVEKANKKSKTKGRRRSTAPKPSSKIPKERLSQPKQSTSKDSATDSLHLNEVTKKKKVIKRKLSFSNEETPGELRRSRRSCVLNRTSFSYRDDDDL